MALKEVFGESFKRILLESHHKTEVTQSISLRGLTNKTTHGKSPAVYYFTVLKDIVLADFDKSKMKIQVNQKMDSCLARTSLQATLPAKNTPWNECLHV